MKTKSILSYFLAMIVASGMFSCSSSNNDGEFIPPFNPSPTTPVAYTIMLYCTGGENLDMGTESDFKKICEGLQKVSNVEMSRKIIHTGLFLLFIIIDIFLKNTIHQIIIPFIFIIINLTL